LVGVSGLTRPELVFGSIGVDSVFDVETLSRGLSNGDFRMGEVLFSVDLRVTLQKR